MTENLLLDKLSVMIMICIGTKLCVKFSPALMVHLYLTRCVECRVALFRCIITEGDEIFG